MMRNLILATLLSPLTVTSMTEEHRVNEYNKRGYKWPLAKMVPDTPGWRRIMERRFEQVSSIFLSLSVVKLTPCLNNSLVTNHCR